MRTLPTIVITGATSGIGRLAAIALASQGVRLGITARSQQRADATRAEIQAAAPGTQVDIFLGDASELVSTLRDIGFKDIDLETRELTAVLEGGIPQALELAVATSAAAGMEAAPADRQQALRAAIADALQPFLKYGAVELLSIAHICRATAAS